MKLRRDPARSLLVGFLLVLGLSTAQVGWWILDQTRLAVNEREGVLALYEANARAVSLAFPEDPAATVALMPHLDLDPDREIATVRDEARQRVNAAAASRINRYRWEGGFFLLVLLAAMVVLTRTIRHDADLRHRQQNFLAAVSHEFKSPLTSLRLTAETLMTDSQTAGIRRLGDRMLKDCDRLLRMVEDLLDTTRLEEGHLAPRQQAGPLRLLDIVGASVLTHRPRARQSGIGIHVSVAPDLVVDADRTSIETVLGNLLDNAIKACLADEGANVWIAAEQDGAGVRMTVRDDGRGFPPEDASMIFEKFYRLGDERHRTTSGTGLGLYIARGLADLSGATITASSPGAGKGATVAVLWPSGSAEAT